MTMNMHRYDAGWPRDDSEGCIVDLSQNMSVEPCGKPEHAHQFSEYPAQRPDRSDDYLVHPYVD